MRLAFTALLMALSGALVSCGVETQANIPGLSKGQAQPLMSDYHPQDKGWKLIWGDEFNAPDLDRAKWEPEVSCWGGGNNERQCYTDRPENIVIEDGLLKLKAQREQFRGPEFPQGFEDRGRDITRDYTSGKLRTRGKASWKYGRISARIKLPKGQSTWPAFWMLPIDEAYGGWPLSGEIDIMEAVNLGAICEDCGDSPSEYRTSAALHFGKAWPENVFVTKKRFLDNPKAIDGFHEFAVEWGEGQFNWFVDGEKFFSVTADDWYSGAADKADNINAPFDKSFYLMLNLAVGGNYPDKLNENSFNPSSFPNELWVDWVRVYQCENDMETGRACF